MKYSSDGTVGHRFRQSLDIKRCLLPDTMRQQQQYYTVENQSNKDAYIGKVKTDGTDNTVIRKMDKTVEQSFNNRICVIGDWIFYRIDNKLHMIKVDGTGEQILE